ncbi:Uncharacterised protein [Serratia fonticola]|jgi:hypothetical protein|nr:Uncharacterised protein [Serratia fonticola]
MSARLLSLATVYATLSTCTFRQYIPSVSQAAALLTATDSLTGAEYIRPDWQGRSVARQQDQRMSQRGLRYNRKVFGYIF